MKHQSIKIPLTQGKFALIDPKDHEKVSCYKWHVMKSRNKNRFYAITNIPTRKGYTGLLMHRLIAGKKDYLDIDHKNRNGLDNRRFNLRHCTRNNNIRNTIPRSTSGYKGVYLYKPNGKFQVQICVNYKKFSGGYFDNEHIAALAYNAIVKKLFGQYAVLNKVKSRN